MIRRGRVRLKDGRTRRGVDRNSCEWRASEDICDDGLQQLPGEAAGDSFFCAAGLRCRAFLLPGEDGLG